MISVSFIKALQYFPEEKNMAKAKKKSPAKAAPKAKTKEMVIVSSKVKGLIRGNDCNCSSDALDGLNGLIYWYVDQATKRASANGRKTVRAHDFTL